MFGFDFFCNGGVVKMDKFLKFNMLLVALVFILISYIQQFYYSEARGLYIVWGMVFMFLINAVFNWHEQSKQKAVA